MSAFTLEYRIALGVTILLIFAIVDLVQKGKRATRWREYAFLLACVAGAIVYGIVNDQITSRISWEYFYYGKELAPIIGDKTPPDPAALHWQAVRIGTQATWSAGLIAGAIVLFANSLSHRKSKPVPVSRMLVLMSPAIPLCIIFSIVLAYLGYRGHLNWMAPDWANYKPIRPQMFMTVFGIHLGGYAGGLAGTIYAVLKVVRTKSIQPDV